MTNKMTFTMSNGATREIQFVGTPTSYFRVWITGQEHGGLFGGGAVHMHGICTGVIHAFTDMAKVHRYSIHFPGLHLRPTMDKLTQNSVVMENIGYVSNHYAGQFKVARMDKLSDPNPMATVWGAVSLLNGTLVVSKRIEYREGVLGEADYVGHERNAINLMNGFDMLLTGMSFDLRPMCKNGRNKTTGEIIPAGTIISNELMTAEQILLATDEDAISMISERVASKNHYRAVAQANAAIERACDENRNIAPGMTTLRVITCKSPLTIETRDVTGLDNLKGYLFKGNIPVTAGIQDLLDPAVQASIRKNNLCVELAAE